MTPTTTVGDLTANDIGRTELIVRHDGSTVTGTLMGLHIETEVMEDPVLCSPERNLRVAHVGVALVIGSISVGPLSRDHACEVVS